MRLLLLLLLVGDGTSTTTMLLLLFSQPILLRVLPTIFFTHPIPTKLGFLGPPSPPLSIRPIANSQNPTIEAQSSKIRPDAQQETRLARRQHRREWGDVRPVEIAK